MPYTDPFRLRVLKALTAALREITPANGYKHDLSSSVFRGRNLFGDDDPVPMVCILEASDEESQVDSPRGSGDQYGPWPLLIQGWSDDDSDNPTDPAHHLLADVKARLAVERQRDRGNDILGMGGLVDKLDFSAGVVRPVDAWSAKAYFWLRVDLTVVEDVTKPFD